MFDDLKDKEDNKQGDQNNTLKEKGLADLVKSVKESNTPPLAAQASPTTPLGTEKPGLKTNSVLEDIFSDTEEEQKPAALQPKTNTDAEAGFNDIKEPKMLINKLFMLASMIIAIALFGAGSYWGYNYVFGTTEEPIEIEGDLDFMEETPVNTMEEDDSTTVVDPEEPATIPVQNNTNVQPIENTPVVSTKDSDQDGLTDQEELELGTNANGADSDQDGLFDREEVKVYKTDPLNPDTDGDTYLDGAEVEAGYNPNGDGKLFKI